MRLSLCCLLTVARALRQTPVTPAKLLRRAGAAGLAAAALTAAPLACLADGQTDKFKLPPINFKDTTRCVFKSSAMGQANGARDTLADFRQCSMNGKSADGFDLAGAIMSEADFCLLYTSPSPRDKRQSRMPSSA